MTLVIGLTGSIGTGKSTISHYLIQELKIPVIDADIVAREVVEPNKTAYNKIVHTFGKKVLYHDKTLNRKALGKIIFADKEKRDLLNHIIHPEIRKEMLAQRDQLIDQDVPCVVMDIPLLFESGLTDFVDKIIVVKTEAQTQLQRIIDRDGMSKDAAQKRIDSQMPIEIKAEKADAVIDNNAEKFKSYQQLEAILKKWKAI